jgi:hypothetical protein
MTPHEECDVTSSILQFWQLDDSFAERYAHLPASALPKKTGRTFLSKQDESLHLPRLKLHRNRRLLNK